MNHERVVYAFNVTMDEGSPQEASGLIELERPASILAWRKLEAFIFLDCLSAMSPHKGTRLHRSSNVARSTRTQQLDMAHSAVKAESGVQQRQSSQDSGEDDHPQTNRLLGRITDILLNAGLLIIPMVILSVVLLGLVLHYQVTQGRDLSDTLTMLEQASGSGGVYYVYINPTLLLLPATWSSSLAHMLAACIVALVSYPVAREQLRAVKSHETWKLPTPYQLGLMLSMIDGAGMGSLYKWLKYLAGWKKKREHQAPGLTTLASVLVLATCLR